MSSIRISKQVTILRVVYPYQGTKLIVSKGGGLTTLKVASQSKSTSLIIKKESVRVLRIGIQGPPGPPGAHGSGSGGTTEIEIVIPEGETRVIDRFESDFRKWALSLRTSSGQMMSYELVCSKRPNDNEFIKYGLLGDRLNHIVDFVNLNDGTEFRITNNLTDTLTVTSISF